MDIYLTGAPLDKLFSEISCGDVGLQGVSVIVPESEFQIVIDKIRNYDSGKWFQKSSLCRFLPYRCDKKFLALFINEFPDFVSKLSVGSYIYANSDVDVLSRLNDLGLLPEINRVSAVLSIKELAVDVPDAGFLRDRVRSLMSEEELADILQAVRDKLLPNLDDKIDSWNSNYNGDDDPEAYFEDFKSALNDYIDESQDEDMPCKHIAEALSRIEQVVEDLKSDYEPEEDEGFWRKKGSKPSSNFTRSIFDDVDC